MSGHEEKAMVDGKVGTGYTQYVFRDCMTSTSSIGIWRPIRDT